MANNDEVVHSEEKLRNRGNEVACPKCHAGVAAKKIATHLTLQCPSRKGSQSSSNVVGNTPKTGLLAEYADEQQREVERRANPMYSERIRSAGSKEVVAPGGPLSSWPECRGCGEHVRPDLSTTHECQARPLYTQFAPYVGLTSGALAEAIERALAQRPGSTAGDLAFVLWREFNLDIDRSIVNSVLYSFRHDRFRKVPEGDSFDERKPPRWYCLRNIGR